MICTSTRSAGLARVLCACLLSAAWFVVACQRDEGDAAAPSLRRESGDRPGSVAPESGNATTGAASANPDFHRGRWRRYRTHQFDADLTPEQRADIERLEAIGYLDGSVAAPSVRSVVRHDPNRAHPGFNFYTSGHAPEALLTDMEGNVLHRWHYEFDAIWPDYPIEGKLRNRFFWRRAHLFPNGDILAIHEGLGIIKLDKDSKLLWSLPIRAHHDFDVRPDGDIVVLTREAHIVTSVSEDEPILEDFVTVLDSMGREKSRFSLLEAFENAAPGFTWREASRRFWANEGAHKAAATRGDIFHTNSVQVLDGALGDALPEFREGNLLVSFCHLNTIAVVDPVAKKVVWAVAEKFSLQHDPSLTAAGKVLVFNNHFVPFQTSSVQRFDPVSREIEWQYSGSEREPFFSRTCGTAAELPNGNILITESDNGRAFEITPDGTVVWDFYNPNRAGDEKQFIATLFELVRVPADFPMSWARGAD